MSDLLQRIGDEYVIVEKGGKNRIRLSPFEVFTCEYQARPSFKQCRPVQGMSRMSCLAPPVATAALPAAPCTPPSPRSTMALPSTRCATILRTTSGACVASESAKAVSRRQGTRAPALYLLHTASHGPHSHIHSLRRPPLFRSGSRPTCTRYFYTFFVGIT
jgi:hypothetical protein